jgi:hypothetical protein
MKRYTALLSLLAIAIAPQSYTMQYQGDKRVQPSCAYYMVPPFLLLPIVLAENQDMKFHIGNLYALVQKQGNYIHAQNKTIATLRARLKTLELLVVSQAQENKNNVVLINELAGNFEFLHAKHGHLECACKRLRTDLTKVESNLKKTDKTACLNMGKISHINRAIDELTGRLNFQESVLAAQRESHLRDYATDSDSDHDSAGSNLSGKE